MNAPRLSAKDWQNLRRHRLVGPKLAGIEVPCVECGTSFMRQRGQRTTCYACGQRVNWEKQNARRSVKQAQHDAEQATEEWIKDEVRAFEELDHFQQASYEYKLREQLSGQRDDEREHANLLGSEMEMLKVHFEGKDRYAVEEPLKHALTPDGPDEGYSTYFLPKTEDGYLEASVDWAWRTDESARWWAANPHAFADM